MGINRYFIRCWLNKLLNKLSSHRWFARSCGATIMVYPTAMGSMWDFVPLLLWIWCDTLEKLCVFYLMFLSVLGRNYFLFTEPGSTVICPDHHNDANIFVIIYASYTALVTLIVPYTMLMRHKHQKTEDTAPLFIDHQTFVCKFASTYIKIFYVYVPEWLYAVHNDTYLSRSSITLVYGTKTSQIYIKHTHVYINVMQAWCLP